MPDLNAFLIATIIAQLLLFMCKKRKENEAFFFDSLGFDREVIVPVQNAVIYSNGWISQHQ